MNPLCLKTIFQDSLKGINGTTSSKRLLGITAGFTSILISLVGAVYTLINQQWETFIEILLILGAYSATLLNAGLFEKPLPQTIHNQNSKHLKAAEDQSDA